MKMEVQIQVPHQQRMFYWFQAEDAPVTMANDCNFIINSDLFVSLNLIVSQYPNCAASN